MIDYSLSPIDYKEQLQLVASYLENALQSGRLKDKSAAEGFIRLGRRAGEMRRRDIANLYFKRAVELDPERILEIREIAKRTGVSMGGWWG